MPGRITVTSFDPVRYAIGRGRLSGCIGHPDLSDSIHQISAGYRQIGDELVVCSKFPVVGLPWRRKQVTTDSVEIETIQDGSMIQQVTPPDAKGVA
jgi:hypothetical protein